MEKTITVSYDEYHILQNQSKLFEQLRNSNDVCVCLDHSTKKSYIIKGKDETIKTLTQTIEDNRKNLECLTTKIAQTKVYINSIEQVHRDQIRIWAELNEDLQKDIKKVFKIMIPYSIILYAIAMATGFYIGR